MTDPTAYNTYELLQPIATHRRPATCAEVNCMQYLNGWATTVADGSADETIIRDACAGAVDGRRRKALPIKQEGGFTQYVFEAGQPCFRAGTHTTLNDREALGIRRDGNRLGVGRADVFRHANLDEWVEDFGEHQDKLSDEARKG